MFRQFSSINVIPLLNLLKDAFKKRERAVVVIATIFLASCNMASSVSKGFYDEIAPINELFNLGQYGDALKSVNKLENDIESKQYSDIDRKMIFSLKSALLWQLHSQIEAIRYMRMATEIMTDRKDYELGDLDSLAKMCVTVEDIECSEYAFNYLNRAIVSDLRDGDLKLVSDWSGKNSSTPEHEIIQVQFKVTAAGIPADITILRNDIDRALAEKAMRQARAFRYIPKVENGVPVETPNVRVSIYLNRLKERTAMTREGI